MNKLLGTIIFTATLSNTATAVVNPSAPRGGVLIYNEISQEPSTLRPVPSYEGTITRSVRELGCSGLLMRNEDTYKMMPAIAESWTVSKDSREYTFNIRPNAYFHDGTPVTAEDVKYSFQVVDDMGADGLAFKPIVDQIEKIEVTGPLKVTIRTKKAHYQFLSLLATQFSIIPKHIYHDPEKYKSMTKSFICSGPYKFDSWSKGQKMVFTRFDKWFGFSDPKWNGYFNFDKIVFKYVTEAHLLTEMVKKGDIDFSEIREAQYYDLNLPEYPDKNALKFRISNGSPRFQTYYGFNLRKPILKSKNVRLAIAMSFNAKEVTSKLLNNLSVPSNGPFHMAETFASKRKPLAFDLDKAKKLLREDGWKDENKDGILEKLIEGKITPLEIEILYASKRHEPALTNLMSDLKKIGVKLNMKFVDGPSYWKILDDGKMDMWVAVNQSTVLEEDPKPLWHSESIGTGGENRAAYSNKEVDQLIDKAREIINDSQRNTLFRKAGDIIADDAPFIFAFESQYVLYISSNRIRKPAPIAQYHSGLFTWWSADAEKKTASK